MIHVCSADKTKRCLLEKELRSIAVDREVIVNMGGNTKKAAILINKPSSIQLAYERVTRNSLISNYIPVLQGNREGRYPMIIKENRKRKTLCDEDALVVQNSKEWKIFYTMFGGDVYTEFIFKPTSEYLLFCTPNEVFFSVKLFRLDKFKDKVLMPDDGYIHAVNFLKPKLWKKIEDTSKTIIRGLDLDFGMIKIGYSSEDAHSFFIHSVKTDFPLIEGLMIPFISTLSTLITSKVEYSDRLKASVERKTTVKIKPDYEHKYLFE